MTDDDHSAEILRYFEYAHLPPGIMMDTSKSFHAQAQRLVTTLPSSVERSAALRHLLEAKDCAVRAAMDLTAEDTYLP
jgi:hypothetical protein